jgi:HEAT repeat protein
MILPSPNLHLDALSFWMGIITASLLWWFLSGLKQLWPSIKMTLLLGTQDLQKRSANTVEERWRRETVRQAQGAHLAFPLFSLDEILVPPRLLAPPPQASPENGPANDDVIAQSIMYTPEWPEMAASYSAETLAIYEPLTSANYLAIIGQPGAGKSTALAHLVCMIARRECPEAELNELLPIMLHAVDLPFPIQANNDPAKTIIDLAVAKAPGQIASQLPALIRANLASGKTLLAIDGIDELPATNIREVSAFLDGFIKQFPLVRVAAAASPDYWDGLSAIGFRLYAVAHWTNGEIDTFLENWCTGWSNLIDPLKPDKSAGIDPTVTKLWLANSPACLTPFERTTLTWSALAGDITSPRPVDALEGFLQRLIEPASRPAIEKAALQMMLFAQPALAKSELTSVLSRASSGGQTASALQTSAGEASGSAQTDPGPANEAGRAENTSLPLRFLVENGIFCEQLGDRFRFFHPILAAYLAACALNSAPEQVSRLVPQQGWTGKHLTIRYLASRCDISLLIEPFLLDVEEPLYRNIFTAARWLRDCSGTPAWKIRVMRSLVEMVQSDLLAYGIRQRALTALVCSMDANLPVVFKQFLGSKSLPTVQLAALGCGSLRDTKLVPDLISGAGNLNPGVVNCTCLALVAIGTQAAIEEAARTLLTGDELGRRAAAEALASNAAEGYAILKDGSVLSDILVRRAVVFGLAKVHEGWAVEILEKMRIEDGQWVVRNAAAQAIEEIQKPNPALHKLLPPPAQSPWLIAFAAKQGLGIAGNSPAIDILLLALKTCEEEERLAALEYLHGLPNAEVIAAIFESAYNAKGIIRETAVNILYDYAASGVTLPAPVVFGLGKASLR